MSETNWVRRRKAIEDALTIQPAKIWNSVRAAIQDACDSFNELYPAPHCQCFLENGKRIRVERLIVPANDHHPTRLCSVLVTFNPEIRTVAVTTEQNGWSYEFMATPDAQVYLMDKNQTVMPDDISHAALKLLFFTS